MVILENKKKEGLKFTSQTQEIRMKTREQTQGKQNKENYVEFI